VDSIIQLFPGKAEKSIRDIVSIRRLNRGASNGSNQEMTARTPVARDASGSNSSGLTG